MGTVSKQKVNGTADTRSDLNHPAGSTEYRISMVFARPHRTQRQQ
jgi:hypothetical protein